MRFGFNPNLIQLRVGKGNQRAFAPKMFQSQPNPIASPLPLSGFDERIKFQSQPNPIASLGYG